MTIRLQLNTPLLPVLTVLLLFLEIVTPSKIWVTLLVGLGGGWLIGYGWVRALAHHLSLARDGR